MLILLGIVAVAGGLFLFLWYRTLVLLPLAVRPSFVPAAAFKWGVPALSLLLSVLGFWVIAVVRLWIAFATFAAAAGTGIALVKFDRYTANMRIIYDYYRSLCAAEPSPAEALYLTARWRYPDLAHDQLVELVAGKDIESLILLMVLKENHVNPISDWDLYRSLRDEVSRIVGSGK